MSLKPVYRLTGPSSSHGGQASRASGEFRQFGVTSFGGSGISSKAKVALVGGLGILWTGLFATLAIHYIGSGQSHEVHASEQTRIIVEKPATPEMIDILVPIKEIRANTPLLASDFIRVSRQRIVVGDSVVNSFDEIQGTYARSTIPANLPLGRDLLTKDQGTNQVIANIPAGFRAVTISVNATTGVEGWARAGARVDVQWIGELRGERVARKLVENSKVLSAERQVDPHADPSMPLPTTVTLLVAEKDAQRVSLAQTAGSLVLLLRGSNDVHGSTTDGTLTWSDLLGRSGNPDNKSVEGVVRVREANGTVKEFAIVDGAVMKRK